MTTQPLHDDISSTNLNALNKVLAVFRVRVTARVTAGVTAKVSCVSRT